MRKKDAAIELARNIDQFIADQGLLPLINSGEDRFNNYVKLTQSNSTSVIYHNAYCLNWYKWVMIPTQKNDFQVYHLDELKSWGMFTYFKKNFKSAKKIKVSFTLGENLTFDVIQIPD